MSKKKSSRRRSRAGNVHKPHGVIHPRVQKIGPEHLGIVAVDVGKAKSLWMLSDFYGNLILPPNCAIPAAASTWRLVNYVKPFKSIPSKICSNHLFCEAGAGRIAPQTCE